MRGIVAILVSIAFVVSACTDSACLPEPSSDATAPVVSIRVSYQDPSGMHRVVDHGPNDGALTLEADAAQPVVVTFTGADSSGLRSLSPGITLQQTVGIGVERRYVDVDPVQADCPVASLTYTHELHGTGTSGAALLSVVAQNWMGTNAHLEPLSVRMH